MHIVAKNENDLVIEDDIESETILGDGKAGLLEHQDNDMNPTESLNKSKGKLRGMSGPISSNLDVSRYPVVVVCVLLTHFCFNVRLFSQVCFICFIVRLF